MTTNSAFRNLWAVRHLFEQGVTEGFPPAFAVHIMSGRVRYDITQQQLAERIGARPETVCRWELGQKCPSRRSAALLSVTLGGDAAQFRDILPLTYTAFLDALP